MIRRTSLSDTAEREKARGNTAAGSPKQGLKKKEWQMFRKNKTVEYAVYEYDENNQRVLVWKGKADSFQDAGKKAVKTGKVSSPERLSE